CMRVVVAADEEEAVHGQALHGAAHRKRWHRRRIPQVGRAHGLGPRGWVQERVSKTPSFLCSGVSSAMKRKAGVSGDALDNVTAAYPGAQQVSASASRKRWSSARTIAPPSMTWNTIAGERTGSSSVCPGRSIRA